MTITNRSRGRVDSKQKPQEYNGLGAPLAKGMEVALTLAVFAFVGYLADRALGVLPLFTLILSLLAIVGMYARVYYGYRYDMSHPSGPAADAADSAPSTGSARQAAS